MLATETWSWQHQKLLGLTSQIPKGMNLKEVRAWGASILAAGLCEGQGRAQYCKNAEQDFGNEGSKPPAQKNCTHSKYNAQ